MNKQTGIKVNSFQLNVLLTDEQKEDFDYLLNHGVFCNTCGEICEQGVEVKEIYLTSLNDIMVNGSCNACNEKVTRIMEFGEDKYFFNKANDFRSSIGLLQ